MDKKDKELLLKDLCARLPYGVKALTPWKKDGPGPVTLIDTTSSRQVRVFEDWYGTEEIKPYLRPLSSMTEEELKELNEKYGNIAYFFIQEPPYYHGLQAQHSDIGSIEISEFSEIYDWLNAHHFDYRGIIEKGLAIEVTPENNPYV